MIEKSQAYDFHARLKCNAASLPITMSKCLALVSDVLIRNSSAIKPMCLVVRVVVIMITSRSEP